MSLNSVESEKINWIKGVAVPRGVRFRQILVTGPPGSGKSSLIEKLGGWPEEGCINLAMEHWWRNRILAFRPREVHFSIPFKGYRESRTVFDREWLARPSPVDTGRIRIPPGRMWFFQTDWRKRFVFDFQLPPPSRIYTIRKARALLLSHPVDRLFTEEEVERQCDAYNMLALHFHQNGMQVYIRNDFAGPPCIIIDT